MAAEKREKIWPNLTKVFCLFFIFLNHSEVYSDFYIPFYSSFVAPFFVNAFFFISGYFLIGSTINGLKKDDSLKNTTTICKKHLLNIVFKLIIPAFIFSSIEYIPACLIRKSGFSIKDFLYKTVGGGTYWFVSALVIAELLIVALSLFKKKNAFFYLFFSVIFCVGGICLCKYNIKILDDYPSFPYNFKQGLIASVFLGFGGVFYQYEKKFDDLFRGGITLAFALAYFSILILVPEKILADVAGGKINTMGILVSLIAIFILIYLFKSISSAGPIINFLSFEGRHSIGLYFMSGAAPATISAILIHLFPKSTVALLVFVFVISFVSSNVINYIMNRYCPFIFDLRKIKRNKI